VHKERCCYGKSYTKEKIDICKDIGKQVMKVKINNKIFKRKRYILRGSEGGICSETKSSKLLKLIDETKNINDSNWYENYEIEKKKYRTNEINKKDQRSHLILQNKQPVNWLVDSFNEFRRNYSSLLPLV
jgi:hypothetical protein